MRIRNALALIAVIAALSPMALGTPYLVSYEPSTGLYPEQCGWEHTTYGGAGLRYFADGALIMDTRASTHIEDDYHIDRPGHLDPGPGELFFMSWRVRIEVLQGWADSAPGLFSDAGRCAQFNLGYDRVYDIDANIIGTFAPGLFHSYEIRSTDMRTYALSIDQAVVYVGAFTIPLTQHSKVIWGDTCQGCASLTDWSYFRFGVVPEPAGALVGLIGLALARAARSRRTAPSR
jgi:hypothetical protein